MSIDNRARIERTGEVRLVRGDGDLPQRLEITVTTSDPVRVYGIDEVLSMRRGAVDLSRFKNLAPFLADHNNAIDAIVGRIENPRVVGDRLVAEVALADSKRARRYAALVSQGMASKISVGFRVEQWKETRKPDPENGVVREMTAVRWTPVEASAVAVPADDRAQIENYRRARHQGAEMPDDPDHHRSAEMGGQPVGNPSREQIQREERERCAELRDYGRSFERVDGPAKAEEVINNGGDLNDLKALIWEANETAYREQADRNKAAGFETGATGDGDPGLSHRDISGFSIVRAADAILTLRSNPSYRSHEIDEMRSANDLVQRHNARPTAGEFTLPASVLHAARERVLEGSSGAGANLVQTTLLADSFIGYLRAESVVVPLATTLNDLVGDYDIPRQTASVNAVWREENAAASAAADQDTDQVELRPKELILGTTVTRRFLHMATPDGEGFIRRDFAEAAAEALDYVAILGSGAGGQPQGVYRRITTTAAPTVGGAGRAANTLGWGTVLDLERTVSEAKALKGELAFVTNPFVNSIGKGAGRGGNNNGFVIDDGMCAGYPLRVTPQIPRTFNSDTESTGGTGSLILFGNWRDVLIGMWTGADLLVNPFTGQMQNRVTVSLHQMADVNIRRTGSFAGNYDLTK